jgi:hypothetical protein
MMKTSRVAAGGASSTAAVSVPAENHNATAINPAWNADDAKAGSPARRSAADLPVVAANKWGVEVDWATAAARSCRPRRTASGRAK